MEYKKVETYTDMLQTSSQSIWLFADNEISMFNGAKFIYPAPDVLGGISLIFERDILFRTDSCYVTGISVLNENEVWEHTDWSIATSGMQRTPVVKAMRIEDGILLIHAPDPAYNNSQSLSLWSKNGTIMSYQVSIR